ncbi:MAG: polyprenyl synthetase family protein, partial [Bacteroidales bacterium]|nr:polyprenyl synthetase family protein [Bacteroidales bacterium]
DLKTLKYYFSKTKFDFDEKFNTVKALYDKYGIRQLAEKQIQFYYQEAYKNIEALNLSEERTSPLIEFIKQLMYRSF